MTRLPVCKRPDQGRTIGVVGDTYRFLATGAETDGRYATWEAIVPPGGGPPPHIHRREEESFYILDGEVAVQVGDERLVAMPGMFVNIPLGCLHGFKNESSQPARMLISVAPAGLDEMFFEIGQPLAVGEMAQPPSKAEIEKLMAISPRYGVELKLPPHE